MIEDWFWGAFEFEGKIANDLSTLLHILIDARNGINNRYYL